MDGVLPKDLPGGVARESFTHEEFVEKNAAISAVYIGGLQDALDEQMSLNARLVKIIDLLRVKLRESQASEKNLLLKMLRKQATIDGLLGDAGEKRAAMEEIAKEVIGSPTSTTVTITTKQVRTPSI